MLSIKWKLYRICTYVQLAYSGLFLIWFIWQITNVLPPKRDLWIPIIVGLVILFMFINAVINLIILAKNFPDKAFSDSGKSIYVTSIIMNFITVSGLGLGVTAGFISELEREYPSEDKSALIILTILGFITIVNLFLLICQFGIGSFLKKNSTVSLRMLIDSIGDPDSRIH